MSSTVPAEPRPARRATIVDVARRAGVSRQTVTRALNGMSGISAATRERVLAAAEDLAYRPSRSGRALVRTETPVIGLLVSDLANAFFSELATAMIREAGRRGWSVIIAESSAEAGPVEGLGERVDALVGYAPIGRGAPGNLAVPVVLLDAPADADPRHGRVELHVQDALEDLVAHLRGVGVRRPAVLDSGAGEPSGRARLLLEALSRLGGAQPLIEMVDEGLPAPQLAAAREAALDRLLAQGTDLVVAFNDRFALEILRGLRLRGVRVPQQVRVVGIDGLALGTLVTPTLTTLASDFHEIARHAVDLAIGIYERSIRPGQDGGEAAVRHLSYRLVVRESA